MRKQKQKTNIRNFISCGTDFIGLIGLVVFLFGVALGGAKVLELAVSGGIKLSEAIPAFHSEFYLTVLGAVLIIVSYHLGDILDNRPRAKLYPCPKCGAESTVYVYSSVFCNWIMDCNGQKQHRWYRSSLW